MASFGDYNRVNTNVTAMDAQLSLNKINRDLGDSRLKLSTGFKINNAEDDAAGFAIATKLKSRVAGLEQALQNVSDAKSVLNIAEGAYNSVLDNLIEMKSLATQAANQTLGSTERAYVGAQIEALATDINDINTSTTYQGIALLDSQALVFQVGEGVNDTMTVNLQTVDVYNLFDPAQGGANVNLGVGADIVLDYDGDGGDGAIVVTDASADQADYNGMLTEIDTAIDDINSQLNSIGISQRSLSGKEVNLTESITANSAARSRIMDTDFAKEQSNSIRLQILQQTATAALSQANMGPQAVLGFLG